MKKLIIAAFISLAPLSGFSQSVFDKYEDMDNVASVIINKGMIDLMTTVGAHSDDPEAQEFMSLAQGLEGVKVFMTEDKKATESMRTAVDRYMKSSAMAELMRVKDEDTHVKFFIRNGKDEDHVEELLMFVTGIKDVEIGHKGRKLETVLVSLTGEIDLTKIGSLTKGMNLPEDLNKAEKKGD